MSKRCKVSAKKAVHGLGFMLLLLMTFEISGKYISQKQFFNSLTALDTVPKPRVLSAPILTKRNDSTARKLPIRDTSVLKAKDTSIASDVKIDTIQLSRDSLDAPITY